MVGFIVSEKGIKLWRVLILNAMFLFKEITVSLVISSFKCHALRQNNLLEMASKSVWGWVQMHREPYKTFLI
jgi:hypothetical protein